MCKYSQSQKDCIYAWRKRNPERHLQQHRKNRMRQYYWNKISIIFNNILLE